MSGHGRMVEPLYMVQMRTWVGVSPKPPANGCIDQGFLLKHKQVPTNAKGFLVNDLHTHCR